MTGEKLLLLRRDELLKKAQHQRDKALVYATLAAGDLDPAPNMQSALECMSRADENICAAEGCTDNVTAND